MKRRRLIALISVCILAVLGLVAVGGGLVIMHTDVPRKVVQSRLAAAVNGAVYVGRVSGNPFSGITIDTLAIRDNTGELFLSSGRFATDYDVRDLMDTRLFLRHVIADHPYLHFRQYTNGDWNFRRIFKRSPSGAKQSKATARSWGDYIVLDSVRALDGSFILSLSWTPDDTLRGRVRDSVINHELARTDHRIEKTSDGYARTYAWTRGTVLLPHVRLVDPDSNKFGRAISIGSLDADESDPPFRFRNVRGFVKLLGDSAWIDLPHWDLPASTGAATGKIVWGGSLPIRYDLAVRGDSVALNDVNWVYPTLPKTGGGKLLLGISNKRDVHVMDYKLGQLDMRSAGSHLTGEMTFGVGAPILQVRNVNLTASPLDFTFIHTLNGKPLPIDWQGQIYGSVRASGGPLTDFEVDAAHGEWRDAHVPGAVSRLSGSGGLDILSPLFTTFHDFHVDVGSLDLRSIEYLFPAFPPLGGTISGQATLDSIWTDVRFRDADILHRDGPGKPSRLLGSGRITDGRRYISYDVALIADSLSFETLARSYPSLKLRGMVAGPITIRGQTPNLQVATRLSGPAGQLAYNGTLDLDSLGGYSARGRGEFSRVNLRSLLTSLTAPLTSLNGRYELDVRGSSARTLSGLAALKLDRSKIDSVVVDSASNAIVRFTYGRAILSDTVVATSPMGRLTLYGSIELPGGETVDSIHVILAVDSIASLRSLLATGRGSSTDSLRGKLLVKGVATGNFDSLLVAGTIAGENLYVRGIDLPSLTGTFSIADALRSPHGTIETTGGSLAVGGLEFETVHALVNVADSAHGSFTMTGAGNLIRDLGLAAGGSWSSTGLTKTVRIDSLLLAMVNSRWALARPATIMFDSSMVQVDSVDFRNGIGGSLGVAGIVPVANPVDLRISASRVPLVDVDRVAGRMRGSLSGFADLSARIGGTRDHPTIDATTALDSIIISDVRIGRLMATARYANERAAVDLGVFQGTKQVLRATADSLPLAISFSGYDTLPGRVRASATADSADFTLIQALTKGVSDVTGKVSGNLTLDGTWSQPNLLARAVLSDATMRIDTVGIKLTKFAGGVTFARDTLRIDSLHAQSGGVRNTASIRDASFVAFDKWSPSWFDLKFDLRDFVTYNRPELATVFARTDSGPVRLFGSFERDSLKGILNVDAGAIYLPDPKLVGKTLSLQRGDPTDTLAARLNGVAGSSLYDRITQNLSTDLSVHLGGAFTLSADYADIPLTGDLRIVPVTIAAPIAGRASGDFISRLAPEGTINADRGKYTVDLFPFSRDFTVERGGTITFDRNADWNGQLNISARYSVRPKGRPDVPIIVDVTDHILSPKVSLRSDVAYLSQSDLLSYLLFGEPGFDLLGQSANRGSTAQAENLVTALLSPLASSWASDKLRQGPLGKYIDQLRLEVAKPDVSATTSDPSRPTSGQNPIQSALYSTRLAGDKELLKDRVYLSFSTGLCGFNPAYRQETSQGLGTAVGDQFGLGIDWRFPSTLHTGSSAQLASEPSTQALLCASGGAGLRGAAPTPRQYSLSFLKFWRW
jgi:translocation and assembly module TamB